MSKKGMIVVKDALQGGEVRLKAATLDEALAQADGIRRIPLVAEVTFEAPIPTEENDAGKGT
jgi:hypothetical protein